MKIRSKLTLLFTAIIGTLLLAFALSIYFSFSNSREEEYFKLLKHTAMTKADLLLDAKIQPSVLQLIYRHSENSLFQEEVAIYDTSFRLLYHDAVDIDKIKETKEMIDEIISKKEIRFYEGQLQAVGLLYHHNGVSYVITAAANDQYGYAKVRSLKYTLAIAFIISIILIYFASTFFSKQALKPVSDMVEKVKALSAKNLDSRVPSGKGRDEISELAITFNEMLDRLEKSFDAQKEFISNVSHELRTLLTAMLGELQLTMSNERTNEEYKSSITHGISDVQKLVRLSNGLLDLAKASYDQTEITFKEFRLDEIVLDSRSDVLHNQITYKVDIIFEKEIENDDFISVMGNEYLLKVAFMNLIENGCKFSDDNESSIAITYLNSNSILRFQDNGIGIEEKDLPFIFDSFYRGENKKYASGNGIGLSLAHKIIKLHGGTLTVSSKVGYGTTFTVELPHI